MAVLRRITRVVGADLTDLTPTDWKILHIALGTLHSVQMADSPTLTALELSSLSLLLAQAKEASSGRWKTEEN